MNPITLEQMAKIRHAELLAEAVASQASRDGHSASQPNKPWPVLAVLLGMLAVAMKLWLG